MSRAHKLLEAARNSPNNFRVTQWAALARFAGFDLLRTRGSHMVFENAIVKVRLVLAAHGGVAPAYAVRQLVEAIDTHALIGDEQ